MLESILIHIPVQDLMWLIVALPFIGFLVLGFLSLLTSQYRMSEPRALVVTLSQLTVLLSFVGVILLGYVLYGLEEVAPSVITGPLFSWKGFLNKPLEFGFKADPLSLVILFAASFIGLMVHIYSVGFTSREKNVAPYFALLNLEYALVLVLIFTDSLFMFFVAWQMVGVVGYIFISRYFTDGSNVRSATIYYIVETIAGSALLLTMILIWKAFVGHADPGFDVYQFNSLQVGSMLLLPYSGIICFSLLLSVVIRSLQFPFYVWMPDASRAPWPVFTFIYGVATLLVSTYILIRLNFILVLSPKVLMAMAGVGAFGALFGSAAAVVPTDVRRVLSYYVIAQAGMAFVGIGVGAFAASIFHIFTCVFYVSLIFFGMGSVMAITGYTNLERPLGLRRFLPVTFWTVLVGAVAAIGIYPLSGFFSRNQLFFEVYQRGHFLLFLAIFVASIFSAIALFRLIAVTFFGKWDKESIGGRRPEEMSVSMLVVMVIVAFASCVVGWLGVGEAFGGRDLIGHWLMPGLATQMVHVMGDQGRFSEVVLAVVATLIMAHAGFITWIIYVQKRFWPMRLSLRFQRTHQFFKNGFYLNDFYRRVVVAPLQLFSEWVVHKGLDRLIVDGVIVGSIGRTVGLFGDIVGRLRVQGGSVYLYMILVGLILFVGWVLF